VTGMDTVTVTPELCPALMGRGWLPSDSESDDELPPPLVRRRDVYGCSDSDTDSDNELPPDELPPPLVRRRDVLSTSTSFLIFWIPRLCIG
jgi:hypothetical protein